MFASSDRVGGTPMGRPLLPLSINAEGRAQLQAWAANFRDRTLARGLGAYFAKCLPRQRYPSRKK